MKVTEAESIDKREQLERLLDQGTVMVFIDSRKDSVIVPEGHKGNPQLPLNLDYAFQIPDFQILDDRVEASLSFNRKRQFCTLPFEAIYAMRSDSLGEVVFFLDDVPKDLSIIQSEDKGDDVSQESSLRPHLVALSTPLEDAIGELGNNEDPKESADSQEEKNPKEHKRPQLRLIKND